MNLILRQINPVDTLIPCVLKMHFNIMIPSTLGSLELSLPLVNRLIVCIYYLSFISVLHAQPNLFLWIWSPQQYFLKSINYETSQSIFCPPSWYLVCLGSKYSSQYPVLQFPQYSRLPYERPIVNPWEKCLKLWIYILIFMILNRAQEDKRFLIEH